jgi:AcrR family transcriptional regulator
MAMRGRAGPLLRAAEGTFGGAAGRARRFPTPNNHERIHAATAAEVAAVGYDQARVESICAIAEISVETFHEHFPGKLEAVLSAAEAIADHTMADCRAAFAAAQNWPEAVWATSGVFTEWGACEPAFARLAFVEMDKAGSQAEELMDSLIDAFALFLAPGYRVAGEREIPVGSLDAEVGHKLLALLREHVLRESPQTLAGIAPELTRVALTPFLGEATATRFVQQMVARSGGG